MAIPGRRGLVVGASFALRGDNGAGRKRPPLRMLGYMILFEQQHLSCLNILTGAKAVEVYAG
jgi:hypothetical protein